MLTSTFANSICRDSQPKAGESSKTASDHKNEGFLKSAWHRLTHQHDNLEPDEPKTKEKEPKDEAKDNSKDDEEPKKASGSG